MDQATTDIAETLAKADALVALCEFDDVIAEHETGPTLLRPIGGTLDALVGLGRLERTVAAVVSECSLDDLREICAGHRGAPIEPDVELFGARKTISQPADTGLGLTIEARRSRWLLQQAARWIAGAHPGAAVEDRPFGVAMDVGDLSPLAAQQALDQLTSVSETLPSVTQVHRRTSTISISVLPAGRDSLIEALRQRSNATILYVGNDPDAHAALDPADVGCTVGGSFVPGAMRLRTARDVTAFIRLLVRMRAEGGGPAIGAVE